MKTINIFGAALALIGALAGSGAIIATLTAMAKFPPFLVAFLLACWILSRLPTTESLTT
ncbi:hypothetical protein [Halopseudomonas bauzanensis]|uniref:Uncharacterized protein n=1 Tax=Halopseudomonas bauzanensis TaxID=653930 RepID=A0A1I4KTA3_9GAMM|nr:hypothetical protein [Halopseudomonas bauzanensis]SER33759.1 hypothetical protein SAMN05216589_0238 [Halopseudomonas bauzanensis]SFL82032.1 hypothetical protein SAMN04487855_1386 [Halopseudomonas bauzanensis]